VMPRRTLLLWILGRGRGCDRERHRALVAEGLAAR
jgi:hypothetical protein